MKKTRKLVVKKVTLRDLDEHTLKEVAGAGTLAGKTCNPTCGPTVCMTDCHTC